ncbi:Mth938-like domain-containing protein [Pseudemcibacter aquimaris]|uniref:Mth938-like domain-containing protein n=1 Tax=Pseudemcibacter aquimaris TaxID=2857064 RepID=UPI002012D90C|nr:Mth938-like domain-containing protein [Pseudemcibacter aquimaris]MCC3860128.1 Mth938-like domain-containing protein [Pseudemcibacter aquimaris]WDU57455.1 Mth938-like domain-containing protein [Pseudemcibacter aquimaris]
MEFSEIKSGEEAFIAGYGNGGFRMGDSRFEGSMLITPKGFYPWDVTSKEDITVESLEKIIEFKDEIEMLIIGMGEGMAFLPKEVRLGLKEKGIVPEMMDTGAAARTYNVLLSEGRRVTAALIAV